MGEDKNLMERLLGSSAKYDNKKVAETLSLLVKHGLEGGASDIHIEPHDRFVLIRYRIAGNLRGVHKLPRETLAAIMSQVKKLANLDPQESNLPQNGIYESTVNGKDISIHVSTMPVYGGEKAVLHLAVHPGKPRALESLGFWGDGLRILQSVLTSPHGLVVVAGPKHSGVSSTLFALLNQLNSPLASVATVEMGVKHRLNGVSQTYTATNSMTIREGLQAALKQDPNIIMVSDMPDSVTAQLAVGAATHGHLIMVGMHADNAIAAALRMRSAKVEPFMLATALRASVGQRLVRQLCPSCKQRYSITEEEYKMICQTFGITTQTIQKRIHELELSAAKDGLGEPGTFSTTPTHITHLWKASPEGCEACSHTGFVDRTAIVEVMGNSEDIQKGIMDETVASVAALQKIAVKSGFIPMGLDGLIKALRGLTTVQEVLHSIHIPPLA